MFRLLKLAAMALFGYALYEFVRGVINDPRMREMARDAAGRVANEFSNANASAGGESFGGSQNITGPGEGVAEETFSPDGGSVRHTVGRGVIS